MTDAGLQRGLIGEVAATRFCAALTVTTVYGAARIATLALEAACGPDAVLASKTSYQVPDHLAAGLARPWRRVGLHFRAPAHIKKLHQIVARAATAPRALATGFALARRLCKLPVLAGVCNGFIGNRIPARQRTAAETLLMTAARLLAVSEALLAHDPVGWRPGPSVRASVQREGALAQLR